MLIIYRRGQAYLNVSSFLISLPYLGVGLFGQVLNDEFSTRVFFTFSQIVYYRGADGFIHVAYLWSGNYVAGKVLMCEEPATNKCLEGGYIGYGDGIVAYEAATYGRPSPLIQAYYYGTCG